MSGWRRCPRCGSGAVREENSGCSGCLGCLVVIGIIMVILYFIGAIFSGGFSDHPIQTVISIIIVIMIPITFMFLYSRFGHSLYCKSCELHFSPEKD